MITIIIVIMVIIIIIIIIITITTIATLIIITITITIIIQLTYTGRFRVETLSNAPAPEPVFQHIQKAWDAPIVSNLSGLVLASAVSEIDVARLKAASSPHSGEWLHAPPIASIGLLLLDEDI